MTHYRNNHYFNIFVLLTFVICVFGNLQDYSNLQHRRTHFPPENIENNDYDQEMEDTQQIDDDHGWNRENLRLQPLMSNIPVYPKISNISYTFDPNIKWDKNWTSASNLGQLSAVDIDPKGNIAILCRKNRVWGQDTFTADNKFDPHNGPISDNVIILLSKDGKKITEWGSNTLYLPHGLTIDSSGNYWLTDVAMHMVMKFNSEEIEKNLELLKKSSIQRETQIDLNNLFKDSIVKPSLALGVAFEPGNDNQRFCKPTAVAVMKNGDFFVSDGYCNSRIIKFNGRGERISQFGRTFSPGIHQQPSPYALYIPHALALGEDLGFLYVADRENGRILCFHALNGTFHREYRYPAFGTKVYSIAYAGERIYAVNGPDYLQSFHVRGFSIDIYSGEVLSQFGPEEDMKAPHDIAVSGDGREIYVVELDSHVVYRFLQAGVVQKNTIPSTTTEKIGTKRGSNLLTSTVSGDEPKKVGKVLIALTLIISSLIIIGLCIAVAAIIARCQKRGCLLSVRKKSYWESDRNENFKLSRVLESRQGKKGFRLFDKRPNTKDFSKLNTEPETSEDEHGEDSLII